MIILKLISAALWLGISTWTVYSGEISVFSQALAQGVLAVVLLITAFDNRG